MYEIYLAGPIIDENIVDAINWRNEVKRWADLRGDIKIISPLEGKKVGEITNRVFTANEIVSRDLTDIDRSDMVLAYISKDLPPNYLMFGTPCEIMYAWKQGIPVVLVTDSHRLTIHYWTNVLCVRILPDIQQALAYIEAYWLKGGRAD